MGCQAAEEYLSQKGVPFITKNVAEDSQAMDELVSLGFMATPVAIFEGGAVVGFDRKKFDQLLDE